VYHKRVSDLATAPLLVKQSLFRTLFINSHKVCKVTYHGIRKGSGSTILKIHLMCTKYLLLPNLSKSYYHISLCLRDPFIPFNSAFRTRVCRYVNSFQNFVLKL